jgi:hypothetical protein
VAFKKPEMIQLLDEFALQSRVSNLDLNFTSRRVFPITEDDLFQYLDRYDGHAISIVSDQQLLAHSLHLRLLLAFSSAKETSLPVFRWLTDSLGFRCEASKIELHLDWELNLSSPNKQCDLIMAVVCGDIDNYGGVGSCSVEYIFGSDTARAMKACCAAIELIVMDWDGIAEFAAYVASRAVQPKDDSNSYSRPEKYRGVEKLSYTYALQAVADWHPKVRSLSELLECYIDRYVDRMKGVDADKRIAVLNWLLVDKKLPLTCLELFVLRGQLHLLKWVYEHAIELGIDFSGKLSENTALRSYAEGLTWMQANACDAITVAEFLCALSAVSGELGLFQWLFNDIVPEKSFVVPAEGTLMNMLHLAASMGRYIIVKWLVANHLLPLEAYCGEGLNACHLAVRDEHVATGLYLLPYLANSIDSEGRATAYIGMRHTRNAASL